jgi:hypothetical protein
MDAERFDRLTTLVGDAGTRRRVVRGAGGTALSVLLERVWPSTLAAQTRAPNSPASEGKKGGKKGKGKGKGKRKCKHRSGGPIMDPIAEGCRPRPRADKCSSFEVECGTGCCLGLSEICCRNVGAPLCCDGYNDDCCPAGSRSACCPSGFPCCPAGSAADCCLPGSACCASGSRLACCPANNSQCCPNGADQDCCPDGLACCPAGFGSCCPPGDWSCCRKGSVEACCPGDSTCCQVDSKAACCSPARPQCCPADSQATCCSATHPRCVRENVNGVTCCQAGNLPCLSAGNTGCCPPDRLCAGGDSTTQLCCPSSHPFGCHAGTAKWCCPTEICGTASNRCTSAGSGASAARSADWAEAVVVPVDPGAGGHSEAALTAEALPADSSARPMPEAGAEPEAGPQGRDGHRRDAKKRANQTRRKRGGDRPLGQ